MRVPATIKRERKRESALSRRDRLLGVSAGTLTLHGFCVACLGRQQYRVTFGKDGIQSAQEIHCRICGGGTAG